MPNDHFSAPVSTAGFPPVLACNNPSSAASPGGGHRVNLTPPRGSHVVARANGTSLRVEIGGTGFLGRGTRNEAGFWLVWTAHLGFVTTRVTIDGVREAWLFGALMAPFWLVSIYIGVRALFGMFGCTVLLASPDAVAVERRFFAWHREVRWPAGDWAGARVALGRTARPVVTHCELALGVDAVKVGQRLSHAEQQWLTDLLNAWMMELKSRADSRLF